MYYEHHIVDFITKHTCGFTLGSCSSFCYASLTPVDSGILLDCKDCGYGYYNQNTKLLLLSLNLYP